jgi:hypothetical protein
MPARATAVSRFAVVLLAGIGIVIVIVGSLHFFDYRPAEIIREIHEHDAVTLKVDKINLAIHIRKPHQPSKVFPTTERLSKSYCESKGYGQRGFLSPENERLPAMLYTFPGSGNTWCRLLIEYATGVYTGCVYDDAALLKELPGEFTCNWSVSAVKVHPTSHSFKDLYKGPLLSDRQKCQVGGVSHFDKAILLVRNPFDSFWAEHQRRVTEDHVASLKRAGFNWTAWRWNAAEMSYVYHTMWNREYAQIKKHFHPDNVLFLRFEDLKSNVTRIDTLRSVAKFLSVSLTNQANVEAELANSERLECAFVLAENPNAHRRGDPQFEMTKDEVYDKKLACGIYNLLKQDITQVNYTSWKNWNCAYYPIIKAVV